jgi:aldose 1-epimerase
MAFEVRVAQGKAGDRAGDVYELADTEGRVRAEVWPQWGFNCLKWQLRQEDGRWADVLYHMPDWETNPVPTRSGHPILFPFPGRLRDGRLTFDGKTYQLPLNDSTKQHAIHGFTPRNKWRVIDRNSGDADECAAVTGEFSLSKDLPEALPLWPSDFVFRVTYRLHLNKLRVEARVENPGPGRLPFGLGYHGYFQLPGLPDPNIASTVLQANVAQIWEAENNLPTGKRVAVPAELDFRSPRPVGETALDNVFAQVTGHEYQNTGLFEVGRLTHPSTTSRVRVLADKSFRELVLFTPVHRKAVAIEPYTCSADAGNFASRGIDSGWRVLEPGGSWTGAVEYHCEPAEL